MQRYAVLSRECYQGNHWRKISGPCLMSTQCRQVALVASIRNILTEFDTKLTESPMECANIVIAQT